MTQIFVKYILHLCIFRHLKLEIALAIPASNDEKYNSHTSISGSWHAPRPGSQRVNKHRGKHDTLNQHWASSIYDGPTFGHHWVIVPRLNNHLTLIH